jgi:aminoglycoside/choline kinase family phosphotransferase
MPDSQQLQVWVDSVLREKEIKSPETLSLSPLSGDAGFRQYFQVNTSLPLLAVMAPKTDGVSESAIHFTRLATSLKQQGVPAPEVIACDTENNFLLIERFEGGDLYHQLNTDTVDTLYSESLLILLQLQQISPLNCTIGHYDKALLLKEMQLFPEWFVEQLLAYPLSEIEKKQLQHCFDFLVEQALEQPKVLVHRDYHSRNLIYREAQPPGVIDFQDAVWGPMTYDPVSLLRDCYVRWPVEDVQRWAIAYGNMAYELGILPHVSSAQFLQWFDTMGLQRHIKVLGIFARLWLRDGKSRYLSDLPLVIRYTLEIAEQYPQTKGFADWFKRTLLPLAEQQEWYSDYRCAGERTSDQ